jgi:hypothetical protein
MSNQLSSYELAQKMREGKILPHPKFKLGQHVQFSWHFSVCLGTIKFIQYIKNDFHDCWFYYISNFTEGFEEKELQEFTDTTILFLP